MLQKSKFFHAGRLCLIAGLAVSILAMPERMAAFTPPGDKGAGGVPWEGQPVLPDKSPIVRSRKQIMDLSDWDLKRLLDKRGYWEKGKYERKIRILGFSDSMTTHIVGMLIYDRRRTQRLMRSLEGVKSTKKRKRILEREVRKVDKLIDNIDASIKRLRAQKRTDAIRQAIADEKARRGDLIGFRQGLKIWVKYPHEGAR